MPLKVQPVERLEIHMEKVKEGGNFVIEDCSVIAHTIGVKSKY